MLLYRHPAALRRLSADIKSFCSGVLSDISSDGGVDLHGLWSRHVAGGRRSEVL